MVFDSRQHDILHVIAYCSSGLSMVGCSFIIVHSLLQRSPNVSSKIIVWLSVADLATSVLLTLGATHRKNEHLCEATGFLVQVSCLASVMWTCTLALSVYAESLRRSWHLEGLMWVMHLVCWGVPVAVAIVILVFADFGDAELWCWIHKTHAMWWWLGFYGFVIVAWLFNVVCSFRVLQRINYLTASIPHPDTIPQIRSSMLRRLSLYLLLFIFIWFWGILNRFITTFSGSSPFWATALHVCFVPLQGFLNAIVYGQLPRKAKQLLPSVRVPLLYPRGSVGFTMSPVSDAPSAMPPSGVPRV